MTSRHVSKFRKFEFHSLIAKLSFFQFINAYFSLFYIAFAKPQQKALFGVSDDEGCRNLFGDKTDECVTELQVQLASIMITRIFVQNFNEFVTPLITAWYARKAEANELGVDEIQLEIREQQKSKAEKQMALVPYSTDEIYGTFWDYNELAITYGYVILFAPAFPLGPALALINNVVENALDAFKLLKGFRRPFWRGTRDIGSWGPVFRIVSLIAVVTNCLILMYTSHVLQSWFKTLAGGNEHNEPTDSQKLLVIVLIEHVVIARRN